jgi:sugar lactone lactonase YvrE
MATIIQAEVLFRPETAELRFLPEGPYPLGETGFSWVAIQHGAEGKYGSLNLYRVTDRQSTSYRLPGRPGFAFATDVDSLFIVGCERTLGLFSTTEGAWYPLVDGIDDDRQGTIINDGVTWDGNLIFGTKDLEFKTRKAGLYLYRGRDGKLIRLRDDQICSNGKAILRGPSGLIRLLDIDSPTRQVVAYEVDIEAGKLSSPKVVLDLTDDPAVPDGMILTPDGKSVIISMYNPNPAPFGETRQYRLIDGMLETVWQTAHSPQNTCPQLVAMHGQVYLVITTAVESMPIERQREAEDAGSIFAAPTAWASVSDSPAFALSPSLRSLIRSILPGHHE